MDETLKVIEVNDVLLFLNGGRHDDQVANWNGDQVGDDGELLAGVKFVSLMTVAGNKYDQIIIDGPPVLGIADAPILANVATGTLMVIQSGATRIQAAQTSVKRLQMTRARLIGCLLTHYDARQSGYGYRYEGYYGYGYGAAPRLGSG